MNDFILVAEAAKLAGVGKSTVRRAIKKGELFASMMDGPNGEQFMVSLSSFEEWMESRGGAPAVHQWSASGALSTDIGPMVQENSGPPWEAYIKSQETVQKALEALERAQDKLMDQGSQLMALQGEMSAQKLLLSSNAESLQERESRLTELEQAAAQAHQKVEHLVHQGEAREEEYGKEREELEAQLATAQELAEKYEKMPGWVKKMFG